MATEMRVCATSYTNADKVEYMKRLLQTTHPRTVPQNAANNRQSTPRIRAANSPSSPSMATRASAAVETMALRVKEVLPQVPISVIQKDIKVTTNVDETITRLLDGTVKYVEEKPAPPPEAQSSTGAQSSSGASTPNNSYISTESMKPFYCGSKTFGKNASERTKSYKERKEALLQTARHRYLERRGLNAGADK
jgi:ancient ubiquitous protein 1